MTINESNNWKFLGDVPVGSINDQLDFKIIGDVLSSGLIRTTDAVTLGVFGKWGTGKTSLMKIIKDSIDAEKHGNIATVWFNAWQYEKEEHLIVPLVATINKSLQEISTDDKKENLKKGIKKMSNALRSIAYGFSVKGKVGIPLFSEATVNLSPKDMIERYQELSKDTMLSRSLYFEAFEDLTNLFKEKVENQGDEIDIEIPRIIVFVDDLDRCFPNQAVNLLEHIKLVLVQPNFAFVLGVNREVIQEAVETKYKHELKIDPKHCKDYLEKIVQVQIDVPTREPMEMKEFIESLIKDINIFDDEFYKNYEISRNDNNKIIELIAELGKRNPRALVRLINRANVKTLINQKQGVENYSPIDVLMQEELYDPKYTDLVANLTIKIHTKLPDSEKSEYELREFLSHKFGSYSDKQHNGWIEDVEKTNLSVVTQTLSLAVKVLKEYPHLCRIFSTDIGRKWLSKEDFFELSVPEVQSDETDPESEDKSTKVRGRLSGDPRGKALSQILANMIDFEVGNFDMGGDLTGEKALSQILANMIDIEAGNFDMGSGEYASEPPIHTVNIKAFKMSKVLVTQAQYKAVMGSNPSIFKGQDNPVDSVSWEDAKEFCSLLNELLSKQDKGQFGLPSEAQWEYACRAGSKGRYCFGDEENKLDEYAWYAGNSDGKTHPVAQKKPNNWGLFDMHGNVWEWCEDDWHDSYNDKENSFDDQPWIDDPRGNARVLRGGSWLSNPRVCRSDGRHRTNPNNRHSHHGFRLILVR